jgi:hypothetical protein
MSAEPERVMHARRTADAEAGARRDAEYRTVARIVSASRLGRFVSRMFAAVRTAWPQARIAKAITARRRQAGERSAPDRVRFAGVMLLAADATHALLVRIEPPLVRPAPLALLRVEAALLGAILLVAAPHLVRAWTHSRLRQLMITLASRA